MESSKKTAYIKPELEDLGTLASRTESSHLPNADDGPQPDNPANPVS